MDIRKEEKKIRLKDKHLSLIEAAKQKGFFYWVPSYFSITILVILFLTRSNVSQNPTHDCFS